MRKKVLEVCFIVILWFLGGAVSPSCAQIISSLDEKEFMVIMWCDDDVGDYCDGSRIKMEEFIFEDDSEFYVGAFKDDSYFDLDFAQGEYEEIGIVFRAEFEAVEELVETYAFNLTGMSIFDSIILGMCEVSYEYILSFKEEEARCYFVGISQ